MTTLSKDEIIAFARELKTESDITKELLFGIFHYHEGKLLWKVSLNRSIVPMSEAGSVEGNGYIQVTINGKRYKAHRLIYKMFHDVFPVNVDHINRIRDDNRVENLRSANLNENARNSVRTSRVSPYGRNVSWSKRKNKFEVHIGLGDKQKHIGYFADVELARQAAIAARNKYHGEFANHE